MPEFLSADALAKRLAISKRSVFRLVACGKLPQPIRLSNRLVRWDWEAVQKQISSNVKHSKRKGGKDD